MKEKLMIVGQDMLVSSECIEMLEECFDVQIVKDSMSAIQQIEEKEADMLVLLSLIVPSIDGYQVLYNLKNEGRTEGLKVVALTGEETYQVHINEFSELLHKTVKKPESTDEYQYLKETLLLAC